jgi:hypothetical protein
MVFQMQRLLVKSSEILSLLGLQLIKMCSSSLDRFIFMVSCSSTEVVFSSIYSEVKQKLCRESLKFKLGREH